MDVEGHAGAVVVADGAVGVQWRSRTEIQLLRLAWLEKSRLLLGDLEVVHAVGAVDYVENELGVGSDLDDVGRDVEPAIRVDELDGDHLFAGTFWPCRSGAVEPAVEDEHER